MLYIQREKTFNEIVDKYSAMIFRIAYQNLHNLYDAEDIMQEVFIKLICKKHIFADHEHIKAWLIRVTINMCINYKKSLSKQRTVSLEEFDIEFTDSEKGILEELWLLEQEDRTILYLYYYEGYKIKEIAKILQQKQNTVNSKLTRARKKLKAIMEVYND